MKTVLRLMLVVLFSCVAAYAQGAPNCNQQNGVLTSAAAGPSYPALSVKCVAWTFSYYAEGFSALSIQVEQAPDNNGVPGAFSAVVATGNPATATTFASFSFVGYAPWIRVNMTSATGTGFVNYTLIGNSYVGTSNSSGGSSSSGGVVFGQDAPGVAPTKNPVQDSGVDGGGLVRRLATDTNGDLVVTGFDAFAASVTKNPVLIAGPAANGVGVVRQYNVDYNAGSGDGAMAMSFLQGTTPTDAVANAGLVRSVANSASNQALYMNDTGGYDGTNWDRYRTASLANMYPADGTVSPSIGVRLAEKGARWSVVSNPAAGTQASASKAAVASTRHVVDCVSFSATESTTAVTNTDLSINVRDGTTGAGTVIWVWAVSDNIGTATISTQYVPSHSICGLNLAGTTNTAMTVEFSAGLTNLNEVVSFSGYDIN